MPTMTIITITITILNVATIFAEGRTASPQRSRRLFRAADTRLRLLDDDVYAASRAKRARLRQHRCCGHISPVLLTVPLPFRRRREYRHLLLLLHARCVDASSQENAADRHFPYARTHARKHARSLQFPGSLVHSCVARVVHARARARACVCVCVERRTAFPPSRNFPRW